MPGAQGGLTVSMLSSTFRYSSSCLRAFLKSSTNSLNLFLESKRLGTSATGPMISIMPWPPNLPYSHYWRRKRLQVTVYNSSIATVLNMITCFCPSLYILGHHRALNLAKTWPRKLVRLRRPKQDKDADLHEGLCNHGTLATSQLYCAEESLACKEKAGTRNWSKLPRHESSPD
jgi:hypothetical protein